MQDTRVIRQVAIKVIRSEGTPHPDGNTASGAARLFQREARAIAALEHSNILPLYDFGEETRDGATITYMVMPYCADGSLDDWLRPRGSRLLPPQTVAYLIEQAAEALQYAHEHEVIHLDVKPPNFLLRSNKKIQSILRFCLLTLALHATLRRLLVPAVLFVVLPPQWLPNNGVATLFSLPTSMHWRSWLTNCWQAARLSLVVWNN